jgi:hypothetical protein
MTSLRVTLQKRFEKEMNAMKRITAVFFFAAIVGATSLLGQNSKYAPLSQYMMEPEAEIALAKSAAPDNVSGHATIKVFTADGYKMAVQGDNGFVCIVMRSWGAVTVTPSATPELPYYAKMRAPICFDPVASRTVLPNQELRAKLGVEGKNPEAIASAVAKAYASGALPKMDAVAFAYMWSADSNLGPGVGAWHPHMMVYAPYYTNAMLGNNKCDGPVPCVLDDAGTPFTVVIIPMHGTEAIKASKAAAQGASTQ